MELDLKGKVVLVTGGSRGIGLRTARALASEGCYLGICGRSDEDLSPAVEELRQTTRVVGVRADMTDAADAERFVDACYREFGAVYGLVNNVGGQVGGSLFEATDEEWRTTFELNVFQIVRMIRLAAPRMRESGSGAIVNVASISGWQPQLVGTAQYGASKAATIFLTERFALELVHDHIRVNTVSPGSIIWEGGGWHRFQQQNPESFVAYERDGFPMGRLGKPEEVADVITFLLSERSHWINGRHIPVDGLEQPEPVRERRPW